MLKKIVISLIVMCFSMGFFVTPAHASDDKHACPVGAPKEFTDRLDTLPYWIDISFASSYNGGSIGCNGTEHRYYMSNKPIVLSKDIGSDGTVYYKVETSTMFIYINRTSTRDAPTYKAVSGSSHNIFSYGGNFTIVANHDVTLKDTGDIVFPKPPAPVDPEIPIVVPGEEMWTVVLDLIYRSALTILVVGLLLMGLWISLRLLSKVLKIFSSRF